MIMQETEAGQRLSALTRPGPGFALEQISRLPLYVCKAGRGLDGKEGALLHVTDEGLGAQGLPQAAPVRKRAGSGGVKGHC